MTACKGSDNISANQPTAEQTKFYWIINPDNIDEDFIYSPKAAKWTYNNEYSDEGKEHRQNLFEVGKLLWNLDEDRNAIVDFEVVKPGTSRLEATDKGKYYIAQYDYDKFRIWENGEVVETLDLWYVFLDNDNIPRCQSRTLSYRSSGGGLLWEPGPDQELTISVLVGEFNYYPWSTSILMRLSTREE